MQFTALIDSVVRQTTVLIAHLATAAGVRAPLAHVANQVFLELVTELERQGLGRKVVADMFGIALRSYQLKVRRLSESRTESQQTLWTTVLDFLQSQTAVSRARVMQRFSRDDEAQVRAVLHDLVESGLVYRTGRANGTAYRAASTEELGAAFSADAEAGATPFVWMVIYRRSPITDAALAQEVRLDPAIIAAALGELVGDGRIERCDVDGKPAWRCERCFVPQGTTVGWEAAVFDHYQALVAAMCIKLREGQTRSLPSDQVGGSTWSFDIWPGHPHREAVLGLLKRLRTEVTAMQTEVTRYNDTVGRPEDADRVTFYLGQSLVLGEQEQEMDA